MTRLLLIVICLFSLLLPHTLLAQSGEITLTPEASKDLATSEVQSTETPLPQVAPISEPLLPLEVAGTISTFLLSNGLRVIVAENNKLPVIHVNLAFPCGSAVEPSEYEGITALTLRTLLRESPACQTLTEEGAKIQWSVLPDFSLLSMTSLSRDIFRKNLLLFSKIIVNPQLTREFVNLESRIQKEEVDTLTKNANTDLTSITQSLQTQLFGTEGYGNKILGTIGSIRKIAYTHSQSWFRTMLEPKKMSLVICGNFMDLEIQKLVEGIFGKLEKLTPTHQLKKQFTVKNMGKTIPLQHSNIWQGIAISMVGASDPSYSATKFLSEIMRSLSPSPILFTTTNKSSILFLLHDKKNSQDNSEEWLDIHLQNCLTLLKDEVKFAQLREKILLNYLARLDSVVSRAHHLTSFAMTAQDYSVMMKLARDWNTLSSQEVIAVLQRFFPSISTKKEPLN